MEHDGVEGLKGWLRTTWLPYTERLPAQKRDAFIDSVVQLYLQKVPLDAAGKAHVAMVRLEVEARKPEQA
jgi:trans-aconitate methyltransferase